MAILPQNRFTISTAHHPLNIPSATGGLDAPTGLPPTFSNAEIAGLPSVLLAATGNDR